MPPYCDEHKCYHRYNAETGRTYCQQCRGEEVMDPEVDIHIWCNPETENLRALYTISVGERALCHYMPKEHALHYLGVFLDELNGES